MVYNVNIRSTKASQQRGLVDRAMAVRGDVHNQRLGFTLQTAADK